jgi:phage terminase Nu1 subunit (DNA packaging protein)
VENKISLSEFSKLIGVNIQTISKAIKQNKIPDKFVQKKGKLVMVEYKPAVITWLKNLHGSTQNTHELRKRLEEYTKTLIEEKGESKETPSESTPGISTYSESQKKERFFKALLAELEYREKQGSLIDKAQAQFQLFSIGKEIRNSLLAIPDRISDDCFAAQSRSKLHCIIYEAIEFELNRIADLGNSI